MEKRQLPTIALNPERPNAATLPPEDLSARGSPEQRALARFAIEGNAIVTGGAGGLGLQAAHALLEHGASGIAIFDVRSPEDATQELKKTFPDRKIAARQLDSTDAAAVSETTDSVAKELGSVDMLCCFAGIAQGQSFLKYDPDEFRRVMDINVTASFIAAQAAAKHMAEQGRGGSIVLIASIAAHAVLYPQCQSAYNISKAAVLHMRGCLAAELAEHGIRVNSISPGYMKTPMTDRSPDDIKKVWAQRNPLGRIGQPGELTGPLVLLCSKNAGSYINGADLIVDGGGDIF